MRFLLVLLVLLALLAVFVESGCKGSKCHKKKKEKSRELGADPVGKVEEIEGKKQGQPKSEEKSEEEEKKKKEEKEKEKLKASGRKRREHLLKRQKEMEEESNNKKQQHNHEYTTYHHHPNRRHVTGYEHTHSNEAQAEPVGDVKDTNVMDQAGGASERLRRGFGERARQMDVNDPLGMKDSIRNWKDNLNPKRRAWEETVRNATGHEVEGSKHKHKTEGKREAREAEGNQQEGEDASKISSTQIVRGSTGLDLEEMKNGRKHLPHFPRKQGPLRDKVLPLPTKEDELLDMN